MCLRVPWVDNIPQLELRETGADLQECFRMQLNKARGLALGYGRHVSCLDPGKAGLAAKRG